MVWRHVGDELDHTVLVEGHVDPEGDVEIFIFDWRGLSTAEPAAGARREPGFGGAAARAVPEQASGAIQDAFGSQYGSPAGRGRWTSSALDAFSHFRLHRCFARCHV